MAIPADLIGRGRTAEVYAWGAGQVLKLYHAGADPDGVRRDADLSRAVQEAGVPAPAVHGVVPVEGRWGIVYDRADGPSLLALIGARPWRVVWAARLMAELHARIHACASARLPEQRARLAHDIRRAPVVPAAARQAALAFLEQAAFGDTVCHGDFHPDNIVLTALGPVVLDWTNAARGNADADVARTLMMLRIGRPLPGTPGQRLARLGAHIAHRVYLLRYRQLRPAPQRQVEDWLLPVGVARAVEGIEEEYPRLLSLLAQSMRRAGYNRASMNEGDGAL